MLSFCSDTRNVLVNVEKWINGNSGVLGFFHSIPVLKKKNISEAAGYLNGHKNKLTSNLYAKILPIDI